MDRRLPPRDGEWIDRTQPIEFQFEGRAYHGFAGDVLSSALWANDVRLLGRSFKYHRPRGIYSLAGHDVNVLVEDDSRTNLRGDVLPIEQGLDLRAVNTFGGLERDRLRITRAVQPAVASRFLLQGISFAAPTVSVLRETDAQGRGAGPRQRRQHLGAVAEGLCLLRLAGRGRRSVRAGGRDCRGRTGRRCAAGGRAISVGRQSRLAAPRSGRSKASARIAGAKRIFAKPDGTRLDASRWLVHGPLDRARR